ncbi:chemotaxis protein CheW [Halanaerobium sp. ST460_2HS_T2]|uniref:chemotaxis protein CheW n=1 Tax=Halanaerobium sp. ST460_2HS_T2 TaxID=2183914 RepID=UPI000DF1D043|nr:chemotaxis protein CheW [Halanaerobium sp. ST460_2HS_T2]RCW50422.1 purine-binding chemotaxis protein CheW [Halanaerobium sp. ST460_2HS_T2]
MVSKEKTNEYLIFKILEQEFAIDLDQSREIIEINEITLVPDSPDYIKGIIKVRDEIIPIVDLAKKMNLESKKDKNKVIIVSIQGVIVGLLVDQISEIVKVDKINKANTLKTSQKVDRAFIEGVLTLNKKLVIVIDTEKLFKDLNLEIDLD